MNLNKPGNNPTRRNSGRPDPIPAPVDERTRIQEPVGKKAAAPVVEAKPEKKAEGKGKAPEGKGKGKKTPEKGRIKPLTVIGVMFLNVFKALLVVLCISLIIGSVIAVQLTQYVVDATANDEEMMNLENYSLAQTSFFYVLNPENPNAKAEGDYIQYQELVGTENRVWVSLDKIPQNLVNAVIATEDREFEVHHGVNFRRTAIALINEVVPIEGMKGGASTITQQLIKNMTGDDVVTGEDGDKTDGYKRKIREIFRAWSLENRYSKEMIMEAYLNTIGLSGRLAGVEAGAQAYFGKSVSELNLAECATIAGITQAPTYYSPLQNPENSIKRRNDVIQFMLDCGYITKEQAQEVWDMPTLNLAPRQQQAADSATSAGVFSYITDKAYNDVIDDLMKIKGYSYSQARNFLYNGGLRIYLTADLNVQAALDNIMVGGYEEGGFFLDENRFPGYLKRLTMEEAVVNSAGMQVDTQYVLPQASAVVINYDGELIATSGGIGKKTSSLSLNRSMGTIDENGKVVGTLRQVGSTMKPIAAYALGIDYGIITYSKMVMDAPILPRDPYKPKRDPETGNPVNDWPSNYGNKLTNAPMSVAAAITESTNTVAAQVGMWVGREEMFEFLRDTLEITSLVDEDLDLAPLVLGAQHYGMSAYELAGAYMMFGGDESYGMFKTLHSYTRVEDYLGNTILEPELSTMQAIDPESGYVMNRLLSNVLGTSRVGNASPTASGMRPAGEMDSVGKTGTTNEDKDRWFVGLTPYYVTAVWWGYDHDHTLLQQGGKGWSPNPRTNIPANIWKTLMEEVQADLPVKEFPAMPEGVVKEKACSISGNLAGPGCPTMDAYYTSFNIPPICDGHTEEELAPPPEG